MNNLTEQPLALEVLIIDDEPDRLTKKELKRIIEDLGYDVTWCANWTEVARLLEDRHQRGQLFPDVALVDLNFFRPELAPVPDQEGKAIISALGKACCNQYQTSAIPCWAYTHTLPEATKEEVIRAGARGFLGLPESKDRESMRIWLIDVFDEVFHEAPQHWAEGHSAEEALGGL